MAVIGVTGRQFRGGRTQALSTNESRGRSANCRGFHPSSPNRRGPDRRTVPAAPWSLAGLGHRSLDPAIACGLRRPRRPSCPDASLMSFGPVVERSHCAICFLHGCRQAHVSFSANFMRAGAHSKMNGRHASESLLRCGGTRPVSRTRRRQQGWRAAPM